MENAAFVPVPEGDVEAPTLLAARLSFNDLGLFDDQDLSESVEIARAHMEIARAVDDVAPSLDALVCTMMGWRTLQDGINPLRPEVYTRALRETLAEWVEDEVWDYIKQNDLPVHPLYAKGYTSIGCAPCTRAINPGEDKRAGRWWWESGAPKECGMHCAIETGGFEHQVAAIVGEGHK